MVRHRIWSIAKWPLSRLRIKNTIVIWYLNDNKLIWGFWGHSGLKKPQYFTLDFKWAWAKLYIFWKLTKFKIHKDPLYKIVCVTTLVYRQIFEIPEMTFAPCIILSNIMYGLRFWLKWSKQIWLRQLDCKM